MLAGSLAWVVSSVSGRGRQNRSAGVVKDELLHGVCVCVCVGHARQGRHGFGYFRTSLPFRSADSLDQPRAIAPALGASRSTDEVNPRINAVMPRARLCVLADPHRGALALVCPSTL